MAKPTTYCGSAHCREKHEWHESGLFLKARNCGATRIRTEEELRASEEKLLEWHKKFDKDKELG